MAETTPPEDFKTKYGLPQLTLSQTSLAPPVLVQQTKTESVVKVETETPVIRTGYSATPIPSLTFLSLIQKSAATINYLKQLKVCIEQFFAKHANQLDDMEEIMRQMLYRLESKTQLFAEVSEPSLAKNNVDVYKWYMSHQLSQVDDYLGYLSKAIKTIPENQAVVLHQYSVDPKAKPASLDISRHFLVDKIANSTLQDE